MREFPPNTGILPGSFSWTKDFNDRYLASNRLIYPKYKVTTRNSTISYGSGEYLAWADGVQGFNNGTAFGGSELPPSGAFDKMSINPNQGANGAGWAFSSMTDKTTPRALFLKMPVPIYLNYYIYEMRGDCCVTEAPTSWSVYGSIDGRTWTHIDSRVGVTGWIQGRSQVFNVTSPPRLFGYFMINSTNLGSVAELRYLGQLENDTWPVLNKYPPTRILYENSLVSKMPYGNGYYKVRASSDEGLSIVRAFDACSSSYWHSASFGKFFYSFRLSKILNISSSLLGLPSKRLLFRFGLDSYCERNLSTRRMVTIDTSRTNLAKRILIIFY